MNIKIIKIHLTAFAFMLWFCALSNAATFAREHQKGEFTDGNFAWDYSYSIGFYSGILMIDVDIDLTGDAAGNILKGRWETGIETIWSTSRFAVPIQFNVDWVNVGADHTVTVTNSAGGWNMQAEQLIRQQAESTQAA